MPAIVITTDHGIPHINTRFFSNFNRLPFTSTWYTAEYRLEFTYNRQRDTIEGIFEDIDMTWNRIGK